MVFSPELPSHLSLCSGVLLYLKSSDWQIDLLKEIGQKDTEDYGMISIATNSFQRGKYNTNVFLFW